MEWRRSPGSCGRCYQNVPESLLPDALKEANPLGIARRVDGILIQP
ncbi:hypothetical protein [Microbacterium hydrocarbonoxydans]|nr:hypothetical protein [Microbacterium hydrocarbonoxydans]